MSSPWPILHVISALTTGGVQHQLAKVVTHYDRGQFDPTVCCLSRKGEIGRELEEAGIEVEVLGDRVSGFRFRTLRSLYGHLRRQPVAVLRAHKYRSSLYAVLAGRMAQVPVIVPSFHLPQPARKRRRRCLIRLLCHWSDRVVAVSSAVAQNLVGEIGVPADKIQVIHNGVDLDDFRDLPQRQEARRRLGLSEHDWILGAVGRMKRQKGFEHLLRALPHLEEGGLRDYQLLMVGEGPLRPSLERQVQEMGLGQRVKFLGLRRDVPELLRAMDLFVFPSLWEGFGTALVEAMLAEVPVVASDLPCIREIIPDEDFGWLVPPGDEEALAQGILRALQDSERAADRIASARERAREHFSLHKVVATYQQMFGELLAFKGYGDGRG